MKPLALILQARGTNRDLDVIDALTLAGADPVGVPLNELRSGKKRFADYQMLVLPGGFSYADALGAGKLLALDLQAYFADEIGDFVEEGKPVIGICNGFQTLVKAGLLPGTLPSPKGSPTGVLREGVGGEGDPDAAAYRDQETKQSPIARDTSIQNEIATLPGSRYVLRTTRSASTGDNVALATLTFNAGGHFECRWVTLRPLSQKCIWTRGLTESIECPVAHGEGNFQACDQSLLSTIQSLDAIALAYTRADGTPADGAYPDNPNGSALDIAGLCNRQGNVLGLMPHPENHIYAWQNPQRTRRAGRGSGLPLFVNGVRYAEGF